MGLVSRDFVPEIPRPVPETSHGSADRVPVTQADVEKLVSEALLRLHDPVALRTHALAASSESPAALRSELTTAIEALRPAAQVDPSSRAWRRYHLLTLRYVEGHDATEVGRRLAVSRSQYYREHGAALTAVTNVLRERGWTDPVITAATPRGIGADLPRRERLRPALVAAVGLAIVALVAVVSVRATAAPRPSAPSQVSFAIYAGDGVSGHVNGPGATARFAGQFGLAVDAAGTLYVADTGNHRIRQISTSGLVVDLAGSGIAGFADGPSADARFSSPNAVTVGPDGTVYVGDVGNLRIRAISPSGIVSTLAGSGQAGYVDGIGTAAQFATTGAIISGPDGSMYVPDPGNNIVRKITPSGVVSTFAGTGRRGHVDGPAGVAGFNIPMRGGGVDAAGNVYVLDTGDNRIRKIAPDRSVSTVAGTGVPGFLDGPASQAQFSSDILGVIADAEGNVFVMDAGNRRIRKITKEGVVSTLFELTDPNQSPGNIKVDAAGNLFLSDRAHNVIYKLTVTR